MRIALLTREYLPETSWGGIGSFYNAFAQDLLKAGHEVEVFTQTLAPTAKDGVVDGVRVHAVPPRFYGLGRPRGGEVGGMHGRHIGAFALALATAIQTRWLARHREQRFDIVEGHEHLGIGCRLGQKIETAVQVVRYHVAYDLLVRRGLEAWPSSRLVGQLEARSLANADLRIATTKFIDEETRQHFPGVPPADHIVPISHGVPQADLAIQATKEPVIAFVGRLSEVKHPRMMATAFKHLSDAGTPWRLEIAGADAPSPRGSTYWAEMQACLGTARDRCRYWGAVDRPKLFEILRRASVIAAPSAFESFGLAALEAMTFGCVPVVADHTALPEIAGEAGIVFQNGNEPAFLDALRQVTELTPREFANLSGRAAEQSKVYFGPDKLVECNIKAFEEALRMKRNSSDG